MHLFVLYELTSAVQWGVYCDEVLERERQRLRPHESHCARNFALILAVLAILFLFGLLSSLAVPLTAVLVHSLEIKARVEGHSKWRQPQLTSEFTEYPKERLPTKMFDGAVDLSKKRKS